MNQNWCRNDAKTEKCFLFEKWWFCENLGLTIVKALFSRFIGSKNRWEIDPKTMQKHNSKKLYKNDQKWCPNGIKMDPKSAKGSSKVDAKIDAKRHPQKEGRREHRQPP
jgi:hypothetical protein